MVKVVATPELSDPDNEIYAVKRQDGTIYYYGKNASIGDDYTISCAGKNLTVKNQTESEDRYEYYHVDNDGVTYYVYYYQADFVIEICGAYFEVDGFYRTATVDQQNNTLTIKTSEAGNSISLDEIDCNGGNGIEVDSHFEQVTGQDYVGTVTLKLKVAGAVVSGYERVYKVYLESTTEPTTQPTTEPTAEPTTQP